MTRSYNISYSMCANETLNPLAAAYKLGRVSSGCQVDLNTCLLLNAHYYQFSEILKCFSLFFFVLVLEVTVFSSPVDRNSFQSCRKTVKTLTLLKSSLHTFSCRKKKILKTLQEIKLKMLCPFLVPLFVYT